MPPLPPHSDSSNNMPPILVPVDDESYPFIRSIANYTASKISSLSESDISLLSDDALSRLIESEFHRLPEEELIRLADAAVSPFIPIAESIIANIFAPLHTKPEHKQGQQQSSITFPQFAFYFVTSLLQCSYFCLKLKLKLSKRSIFLSKTKYSRTLDLKGLKGIGETYIQETATGFRQMMIQESFVNGEAFSLPEIIQESFVNGEAFSLPAITPM